MLFPLLLAECYPFHFIHFLAPCKLFLIFQVNWNILSLMTPSVIVSSWFCHISLYIPLTPYMWFYYNCHNIWHWLTCNTPHSKLAGRIYFFHLYICKIFYTTWYKVGTWTCFPKEWVGRGLDVMMTVNMFNENSTYQTKTFSRGYVKQVITRLNISDLDRIGHIGHKI